jgi:hypothetical protein
MDQELTDKEKILFEKVPETGETVGNVSLMRELAWAPEEYWPVRNALLDKGVVATERGRGGSVRRFKRDEAVTVAAPPAAPGEIATVEVQVEYSEQQLYEPISKVIRESWTKDYRVEDFVLEIVANQGPRKTGGIWSRPDIVVVGISVFQFVPGKHLDITTFEVKPYTALDVTAVYEAVAHLRAATRAFVVLHVPPEMAAKSESLIEDIIEEASRHGVGLIIAEDVSNYETWDFKVEALRKNTDPIRLNDFIAKQLSTKSKEQIQKWCR